MFLIISCLALLFLFLTLYRLKLSLRLSMIVSSVLWGVYVTFVTEILSIFRILTFGWTLSLWLAFLIPLIFYNYTLPKRSFAFKASLNMFNKQPRFLKILMIYVFLACALLLIIALVAAPNNGDSLTYHLSRVMHWQQNKSIAHYPTSIARQLHLAPWSEFAILNIIVLSGGDQFVNLLQWFSMTISLIGVTLIAKYFGAKNRAQIISLVLVVTLPMGILQSTSTQNDYVVSMWLVCFTYFVLKIIQPNPSRRINWLYVTAAGLSLGLSLLTKGTAYIFALPIVLWLSAASLRIYGRGMIKIILPIFFLSLLINLGHYMRNYNLYRSPLGITTEGGPTYRYSNDYYTLAVLLSNTVRNISLHLDSPLVKLNLFTENQIGEFHKLINMGINDPRTTWAASDPTAQKFHVPYLSTNEDVAGNPIHLFLIVLSFILFFKMRKQRPFQNLIKYAFVLISAFLLFSLILRWQYWHSRLHLPLFILFSPLIAIVLSNSLKKLYVYLLLILLIIPSFYWLFFSSSRPIIGKNSIFSTPRNDQYFINDQNLISGYKRAASSIKRSQCNQIGLQFPSAEYPIWKLLQSENIERFRIEHVLVTNVSKDIYSEQTFKDFSPCMIISLVSTNEKNITWKGKTYQKINSDEFVSLFSLK